MHRTRATPLRAVSCHRPEAYQGQDLGQRHLLPQLGEINSSHQPPPPPRNREEESVRATTYCPRKRRTSNASFFRSMW